MTQERSPEEEFGADFQGGLRKRFGFAIDKITVLTILPLPWDNAFMAQSLRSLSSTNASHRVDE